MEDNTSIRLVEQHVPEQICDLADDDLMLLTKRDRQDAFEILVKRHHALIYGLATRFLGDKSLGRDVTQDVFLALWAERNKYRARSRFRSYLVSVALHRCHHVARQRKTQDEKFNKFKENDNKEANEQDEPLTTLIEQERAREIRQALIKLPKNCRQVIILRFTQDLSFEEISELSGMPIGTVKSHVFRGLKRLHGIVKKDLT